MKNKTIVILIFISYLIITFTQQMACNMILIGYNEYETLSQVKDLKYESGYWLLGLVFILFGQASLIWSIILKVENRIIKFSVFGLINLIIAYFLIGIGNTMSYGNVWLITILTSLPFIGLTTYYFLKLVNKNTTANTH